MNVSAILWLKDHTLPQDVHYWRVWQSAWRPAALESFVTWPYLVRSQCWHAEALMCVPDLHCSVRWRRYHCRDNRRMYICAPYKHQRLCTCPTLTCFSVAAEDDVVDPVRVVLHRCDVRILLQDTQASFQRSRGDWLSKLCWDHIYRFTLCWLTLHILMMESRPAVKSRLRAGSSCRALTPLRLYFSTSSLITYDTCNTHTLRIRCIEEMDTEESNVWREKQ